jgi:hypothetical protein
MNTIAHLLEEAAEIAGEVAERFTEASKAAAGENINLAIGTVMPIESQIATLQSLCQAAFALHRQRAL